MADIPNDGLNHKVAPKSTRTAGFICYSRKDQQYLRELQEHLAYYIRKWNLEIWNDTKIRPGEHWREETDKALRSAKIGVLLVSANFFASQQIVENELPQLLDAAREEGTIILCVILRACPFQDTELAHFQAVNDPSTPLNTMSRSQRDTIWQQVAERVWKTLSQESEGVASKPTDSQKSPTAKIQPTNTRATSNDPPGCDICVICAMREEVEAFMHETERLCHVTFQSALGPRTRRDYRYTTIHNNKGEPLSIYVTWPPKKGPEETGLHFKSVLDECRPRFAAMTGICAGDRTQVALGDIIVAERAFRYDTGKMTLDKKGRKIHQRDTSTQILDSNILHFVQMFDDWKLPAADLPRPISKRQQRDWLLTTLLGGTPRVDDIPPKTLEQYAPNWKKIVSELQSSTPPYLNVDRSLHDPTAVRELFFGKEDFPYHDPKQPACYPGPMASGSTVRADKPFAEIQAPVRGTIAIDMEGATFYRTVADFPGLRSLLVKAVSDYADPDKDDSYHKYATSASAIYMLCFIKEYVNDDRMPRI